MHIEERVELRNTGIEGEEEEDRRKREEKLDSLTDMHTYIEIDREKHEKYIQTVRHTHTDGHTYSDTYRHTDMHTDRYTDGRTGSETHTYRHTDGQ